MKKILDLRKLLYNNAEVSNKEFKTRDILKDFLRNNSSVEIIDKGTYFYARKIVDPSYETIAIRADHDSIVNSKGEVFHGCGHDGHSAILCGTILAIEKEKLNKNVIFLFQSAEENGSGAVLTDEMFKENKIDKIYGLHNMPGIEENCVGYRENTIMCASSGYTFKIYGKQSHASLPENSKNPAFVISKIVELIKPLSKKAEFIPCEFEGEKFSSMIMASIINIKMGEKNFGISPANGEISLTIRAEKEEELYKLVEIIKKKIEIYCKDGYTYSSEIYDAFPETNNDVKLTRETINLLEQKGYKTYKIAYPFTASEDFGYYKKFAKSFFFFLGTGNCPPLHDDNFQFNDNVLETGIGIFKEIIMK